MAAVVYPVQGYPAIQAIEGGDEVTIRPMVPEDRDRLLEFFRRIPEEERFYLKEDVTSARVIQRWADDLDYSRTLPLLAFKGERVVADATLHQRCQRCSSRSWHSCVALCRGAPHTRRSTVES